MKIWRSLFDDECRRKILDRVRGLGPDTKARWGRMDAPRMVAHLSDQLRHTLKESPVAPRPGPLRWPPLRWASIYLVPWPKGRLQGPPEAFKSRPTTWEADVAELESLIERVGGLGPDADWPEHALLGRMSYRDWGVFCHKHIDHHLRQFGV